VHEIMRVFNKHAGNFQRVIKLVLPVGYRNSEMY
jgi:hypothetical protein